MKTITQMLLTVLAAFLWASSPSASTTGNTNPTFLFAPQAPTGLAPYAVELADMDGDGDKDFVTSNVVDQEFSTVSVAKNNGDGTFAAPVNYPVGPNPLDLRVADFNGDGKPDVICIAALSGDDGGTSYVTILFNNGTGALINRRDYSVGENANSGGVDVGDYDGDGDKDFAIASLLEGVHVYRNTGNGTFVLWAHFAISMSSTHIASADFNSDGRLDLLVGNTDAAQVYLNNGVGFTAGVYIDNYPDSVRGLATGDFDNDGKPDFVTTGRMLSVFRNLGGGMSFAKTAYLAGENQVNVKTADMDGDGNLDITVSNYLANSVSVYSNNGTGQFPDKREWGVGMAPNSHGVGDVNGDGKLDIVAAASQLDQTTVNVVLNAGNRTYLARRDYGMLGAANGVAFADFDRDSHRDVVSVVYVSNADGPFVFYGEPDGTLQDGIQVENWGNNIPTDVAVGDFNGDGWLDFVSSIFSPGNCIRVSMNQGNGTFLPSVVYAAGGNPSGVGVGDLNGDGRLDIVNSNGSQLDNDISIFIGNGNGTFQPQVRVPVGFRPGGVLLADFDQNGRSEVVVTHYGSNAIYYFMPNAAGVLGPPEIINIGSTQGNAVAADFDNDGWLDIMVSAGYAKLLRNNQSGGFLPPITTPVPAGYLAAGDWDQDGLMDVVGTNGVLDLALVGWNQGGGNFTYVNSLQSGYGTGRAGAADLNADGFPEIVTCNGRARSISVFKNMMAPGPTPSPTPTPTPPPPTPTPTTTPIPTPTPTPTPTTITISGTVSYCSNPVPGPMRNVVINLTGTMSGTTLSDNSGNYAFSSLSSGGSYTVTPSKTALPPASAGIDTVDVIALQRHFLVLGTPLSGCRLTAADVDLNSSINTVDVIAVQRFFLGQSTGIAQTGNYQFSPASRTYTGLVRSQTAENYDTLVYGDVAAGFVEGVDDPSSAPEDRMSASEMAATVATVALPEIAVDQSRSNLIAAVRTSTIDAKNKLVGFQGDFTFDERVVTFQNQAVQKAGLTGGNWNVSGNVLPGAGPIRTLRISAYSNDFTPLSGEGTLFELRMTKVSKAAQSTQLIWAAAPNQFIFIDTDLNTQKPGNAAPGSLTPSAKRK